MSNRFSARIKLASIALLIAGMVSAALAYSLRQANAVKRRPAQGFTLVTKETAILTPGPELGRVKAGHIITTRYQRSDGTWKRVRTYYDPDGKVFKEDIGFGIPGEGVFQVDQSRATLNFISSMPSEEESSYVPIRNGHDDSNFLRDDVVQGYQTYVLRFPDQEGGYTDLYCAIALDGHPIRKVTVQTNGVAIEEPVQINLGDPDDKVFENFPKWFVRYERFEERIQMMEDMGKPEAASAMRQELKRRLAKQTADQ